METTKKSGDVGASLPTKETLLDDSTTEQGNSSIVLTSTTLLKIEDMLKEYGYDVWLDNHFRRDGRYEAVSVKYRLSNVFVKTRQPLKLIRDIINAVLEDDK